ncbi:alpha/beta hydrolase family esterase [Actinomadura parmotrematis]|uniref:Polyhydroxybutyrate depolymerase n=1 Tax=Actinomadura parmotrematis TaxID=2864039 RepID=A0ABS7FWJ3_9ACTN|nr:PHB depolymerase family esterase [Actinomadura parmotrematis]MBW8483818.1 hypothetical protein [Actinomadura parmotrematis]
MRRLVLLVMAVSLLLTACQKTDEGGSGGGGKSTGKSGRAPATVDGMPTAAGTHKQKIDVGTPGHREFLLHVPPQLRKAKWDGGKPAEPLPVVIALHGGLANMSQMEKLTNFDALADEKGFLAVYPDGVATTWNAGDCCGIAKMTKIDDVSFLSKLIDKLTGSGLADDRRVYVTGFSNGAGMAYRMACEAPDKVAAIGVVEGSLVTHCDPDRPVSAMIFHGTADTNVPINGGGRRDVNDGRPFPPVRDAVEFWRKLAGLPAPDERVEALTANTGCDSTGKGKDGVAVTYCKIDGGKHQWPKGASTMLWSFFAAHPAQK